MICPRCQASQPDAPECARCGVFIGKAKASPLSAAPTPTQPDPDDLWGDLDAVEVVIPEGVEAARLNQPSPNVAQRGPASSRARAEVAPQLSDRPPQGRWLERALAELRHRLATRSPAPSARALTFLHLGRLLGGGVGHAEALPTVRAVVGPGTMERNLAGVQADVEGGLPLHEALAARPWAFDPVEVSVLAAAAGDVRRQGRLCVRLHERLAGGADPWRTLARELSWPAFVALTACFLLPIPRYAIAGGAAYAAEMMGNLLLLGAVAGLGFVVLPLVLSQPDVRARLLLAGARIPGVRTLVLDRRWALVCSGLSVALEAGVAPELALHLAGAASGEPELQAAAARKAPEVAGVGIGAAFADFPGLDAQTRALVTAAARAGTLAQGLAELAADRRARFQRDVHIAALGVRGGASAIVSIVVAVRLISKVMQLFADPTALMPAGDQADLQRELGKAYQQVEHPPAGDH